MALLLAVVVVPCLTSIVRAQCDRPSTTILSNTDVEAISSCTTYNGDIVIDSSATGNITLDGIETIVGNLLARNAPSLTGLIASDLSAIEGIFELQNLLSLSTLDVPVLSHVEDIKWSVLPALQNVEFETGISNLNTVSIDNTGLQSLLGVNAMTLGSFFARNNRWLTTVDLQSVENVTNINFEQNSPSLELTFASLQFVLGNMTLWNISALSTPDLQNITGSFECYSCAMANYRSTWLQTVGLHMAFVSTDLSDISFPDLVSIGSLQLSNNTNLLTIDGFDMLEAIESGITLNGRFNSVSFPDLGYVGGNVVVETSSNNGTVCDLFNNLKHSEILRAELTCQTNASESQTTNSNPTVDTALPTDPSPTTTNVPLSESSTARLSGGSIAGIVIGALAGLGLFCFGAYFLGWRRRQTQNAQELNSNPGDNLDGNGHKRPEINFNELPPHGSMEKVELYGSSTLPTEMSAQNERVRTIPGVHEAANQSNQASVTDDTKSSGPFSPVSPLQDRRGMGVTNS